MVESKERASRPKSAAPRSGMQSRSNQGQSSRPLTSRGRNPREKSPRRQPQPPSTSITSGPNLPASRGASPRPQRVLSSRGRPSPSPLLLFPPPDEAADMQRVERRRGVMAGIEASVSKPRARQMLDRLEQSKQQQDTNTPPRPGVSFSGAAGKMAGLARTFGALGADNIHGLLSGASDRPQTAPARRGARPHSVPVDYSFLELEDLNMLTEEKPLGDPELPGDHFNGALFSNNDLTSVSPLYKISFHFMVKPEIQLRWLDLSFNKLTTIEPAILQFPNLMVLYLQGNHIANLKEVKKLNKLPLLRRLALHGNPICDDPTYRNFMAIHVPRLTALDFVRVSKVDRDKAKTWNDAITGVWKPKVMERVYGAG